MARYRVHGDYYVETGDNDVIAKVMDRSSREERKALAQRIVDALNAAEEGTPPGQGVWKTILWPSEREKP